MTGTLNDMTPEALRDLAKRAEATAVQKEQEAAAKKEQTQWVIVPSVPSSFTGDYRFNKKTGELQYRTRSTSIWQRSNMSGAFKTLSDIYCSNTDLQNFANIVSAFAKVAP